LALNDHFIEERAEEKSIKKQTQVGVEGYDPIYLSLEGLFTKYPETIARELASRNVSPKGPRSGMRILT
jgi:hypothetical protein